MSDDIPSDFLLNDVELPNTLSSIDEALSSFCLEWDLEMMIMEKPFDTKDLNGFFVTIKKKDDDKFIFTSKLFPSLAQAKESLYNNIITSLHSLSISRVMDELL